MLSLPIRARRSLKIALYGQSYADIPVINPLEGTKWAKCARGKFQ